MANEHEKNRWLLIELTHIFCGTILNAAKMIADNGGSRWAGDYSSALQENIDDIKDEDWV